MTLVPEMMLTDWEDIIMNNHPGLYSFQDILQLLLAICGAIITISGAIAVIIKYINKAKEPTLKLSKRIDDQDSRLDEHDNQFKEIYHILNGNKVEMQTIIEGSKITQRSIIAIMDQLITGNSLEALQDARDKLNTFLVNK